MDSQVKKRNFEIRFVTFEEAEEIDLLEEQHFTPEERFFRCMALVKSLYQFRNIDISSKVEPIIRFRKLREEDDD